MIEDFVDLYTLQKDLKEGLGDLFPDRIWVKAEIAQISVKSGGHCYLELVQSEGGTVIAKVRAVIWKSYYTLLAAKFRAATGGELSAGLVIMALVTVNFHEVYGLSLVIEDIDVASTVGDLELERRKTVERLTQEGLMDRQKGLRLPELPYSLAVISAEGAAGLQDFRNHLLHNEFGYAYQVDFFPATMQGDGAPESIKEALGTIAEAAQRQGAAVRYDAVLILRGGGSDMDLACFDDYGLAAAIARMNIPVITAIGHDKDYHVADMVAWDHVKTPTALADMFLDLTAEAEAKLDAIATRLSLSFHSRLDNLENALSMAEKTIFAEVRTRLSAAESAVAILETKISATDPRHVLKRGFSLVLDSKGVKISNAAGRKPGDEVTVVFADGSLVTEVKAVKAAPEEKAAPEAKKQ